MTVLVAAVAGSIGAVGRYVISGAIQERTTSTMPLGTAGVNLLGTFLLGVFVGVGDGSLWWTAAAGFTGGLTTFSTWMVETVGLGVVPRLSARALANVGVVATLGVALAAVGYHLAG